MNAAGTTAAAPEARRPSGRRSDRPVSPPGRRSVSSRAPIARRARSPRCDNELANSAPSRRRHSTRHILGRHTPFRDGALAHPPRCVDPEAIVQSSVRHPRWMRAVAVALAAVSLLATRVATGRGGSEIFAARRAPEPRTAKRGRQCRSSSEVPRQRPGHPRLLATWCKPWPDRHARAAGVVRGPGPARSARRRHQRGRAAQRRQGAAVPAIAPLQRSRAARSEREAQRRLQAIALPTTLVLDANGVLLHSSSGTGRRDRQAARGARTSPDAAIGMKARRRPRHHGGTRMSRRTRTVSDLVFQSPRSASRQGSKRSAPKRARQPHDALRANSTSTMTAMHCSWDCASRHYAASRTARSASRVRAALCGLARWRSSIFRVGNFHTSSAAASCCAPSSCPASSVKNSSPVRRQSRSRWRAGAAYRRSGLELVALFGEAAAKRVDEPPGTARRGLVSGAQASGGPWRGCASAASTCGSTPRTAAAPRKFLAASRSGAYTAPRGVGVGWLTLGAYVEHLARAQGLDPAAAVSPDVAADEGRATYVATDIAFPVLHSDLRAAAQLGVQGLSQLRAARRRQRPPTLVREHSIVLLKPQHARARARAGSPARKLEARLDCVSSPAWCSTGAGRRTPTSRRCRGVFAKIAGHRGSATVSLFVDVGRGPQRAAARLRPRDLRPPGGAADPRRAQPAARTGAPARRA